MEAFLKKTVQGVPGITETQKAWTYFEMGILENLLPKSSLSACVALIIEIMADGRDRPANY
ncbi:hypothetical protein C7R94_09745 [Brevibacillus sp. NRRL NRS-603]|nr:hypothetical protein [Brevibacillus formosus]PSK19051.1 hypothetical protein C7R94_09745 [Brevibacillus sp. NRRL NRS-603]